MAKTLTNERNLRQRQEAIARDLRLLKQMRLVEWGAAALFIAAGFLLKVLGLSAAPLVLFIGGVLVPSKFFAKGSACIKSVYQKAEKEKSLKSVEKDKFSLKKAAQAERDRSLREIALFARQRWEY